MTALAHTHDPDTSHQAAARLDPSTMTAVKQAILTLLHDEGPNTSEGIALRYQYKSQRARNGWPIVKFDSIHKRISDLRRDGLVRSTGRRDSTLSGATAVVWEVVS